jgi:AraC family transcriptional activator of pobA
METKPLVKFATAKESKAQIPLFNSISEFLTSVGMPKEHESDFTIDTLEEYFKGKLIKSKPFRTNYFVFVYVIEGGGVIMFDNEEYRVGHNTFYYTTPGHIRSVNVDESLKGYMMSINEQFLKRYYKGDITKDFPFLGYENLPPITVKGSLTDCFRDFFSTILKTYKCEDGIYKYHIINNLAVAFMYKIKELFLTSKTPCCKQYNGSLLVRSFMKLHEEEFRKLINGQGGKRFTVKDFANKLNVNANYLSMVVKKETGKPVSLWINEKVMSEAQSLLLNTDLSIAMISDKLGFDEPSNFIKYFKKKTGRTPKDYRQQAELNKL